ncbi:Tigger transposable element-derived protein 1 [Araneus ventricosus]|uniref:Tigger transposable element-derived protein 1 n=1 Tax=Araneus ventricosus TaxID=182803 RepID=A0A4Y2CVZ5_ARAVE|nr:Tigger transposable element-derived protein 1 [Araneus ventricosus]
MSPKKKPQEDSHKRRKITVEMKRKIIEERERGVSVADLARTYNRSTSTICTILKDKDRIKEVDASKGVTRISTQRLRILDDVERLLLRWINEKQLQGDFVNENIICEKAKAIFADLVKKTPGSSTTEEVFKGSRGWFEKFKRRTGIVVRHGEAASFETKAAENFISNFKKLVYFEGYLPQQVFNCAETGLFWKKMPKRTYITQEENALPGHKPMKDRLTLLFCANASGDLKIKPLLVYHSETPQDFKKCKIQKSRLNVMWRSNNTACVTRDIFTDWINEVFAPSVKKYLLEMNLPLHVLLIMDNSPAHPPDLQDHLLEEFKFIKILFLPPNTTQLLQPMNQQVLSSFKKLYTKALFERCFEVTEVTNITLREFWKCHFHIVACLKMIENAWEGVTKRTLTSAWKKLWPESVVECEFEEPETVPVDPVVYEIVSLAKIVGLEVDSNDIEQLVEEHNQELTTEELLELHRVSQQEVEEGSLSEEEDEAITEKQQSSTEIREMLKAWETVASYIEKHHPNKAEAMRATNLFDEHAVSHFRQILNCQQK